MLGSLWFTWLQGAPFYQDLHRQAVELLPMGSGAIWLDAGCGPGLLTRMAASRGYRATGVDADPAMIRAAERLAKHHDSSAEFAVGNVLALPGQYADVVSAASLLAALDDPPSCLDALWRCVRPGGCLLVIEPTDRMNPENAVAAIAMGLPPKRLAGLRLWAAVREHRAVASAIFDALDGEKHCAELLHGLVGAWIIRKSRGPQNA